MLEERNFFSILRCSLPHVFASRARLSFCLVGPQTRFPIILHGAECYLCQIIWNKFALRMRFAWLSQAQRNPCRTRLLAFFGLPSQIQPPSWSRTSNTKIKCPSKADLGKVNSILSQDRSPLSPRKARPFVKS